MDNGFIGPGCSIAGRVEINENAFVGIGSTIVEKVTIGKNAIIGAGSVVLENVPDNSIVAGVPAKIIKSKI